MHLTARVSSDWRVPGWLEASLVSLELHIIRGSPPRLDTERDLLALDQTAAQIRLYRFPAFPRLRGRHCNRYSVTAPVGAQRKSRQLVGTAKVLSAAHSGRKMSQDAGRFLTDPGSAEGL